VEVGTNRAGEVVGQNLHSPFLDTVQDLADHIGGIRLGVSAPALMSLSTYAT
jgi:hypothetical protein